MTTRLESSRLSGIRGRAHGNCVVCSRSNKSGLGLDFVLSDGGCVSASFDCDKAFEGYSNVLHGGVISCLLDGAMTNCMFAYGYIAVTAELTIHFQHPVAVGLPATVRAWIAQSMNPLHFVKAELLQGHETKATAEGKFMEHPSLRDGLEAADPNDH